jgi:hypothetical protein
MECRHQNQLAVPLARYSVAASALDSLLAVLGGLVVVSLVVAGDVALVLAVALVVALLACRQA